MQLAQLTVNFLLINVFHCATFPGFSAMAILRCCLTGLDSNFYGSQWLFTNRDKLRSCIVCQSVLAISVLRGSVCRSKQDLLMRNQVHADDAKRVL